MASRARNSSVSSAKWQAKMGNWHAKKYFDGEMKEKMASQNVLGLGKEILMALQLFFTYFMPRRGNLRSMAFLRTVPCHWIWQKKCLSFSAIIG